MSIGATLATLPTLPSVPKLATLGAGGVSGVPMDVVIDFDSGTGDFTATDFNNSAHGAAWGQIWEARKNGVQGQPNTYSFVEAGTVALPFDVECDGVLYDGTEGQVFKFDLTGEPASYDCWHLPISGIDSMVAMLVIKSETVLSGSPTDYYNDIIVAAGANFSIPQMRHNANNTRQINAHSESDLGAVRVYSGNWVIVWLLSDATNNICHVFFTDATTEELLGSTVTHHIPPIVTLNYFLLQTYLRPAANGGSGSIKVKMLALKDGNVFPRIPSIATPVATAIQSFIDEITVTWVSNVQIARVSRSTNGGGYVVLAEDYDDNGTNTYVDDTVSEGNAYTYRIVAKITYQESSAGTSNSITVDNSYTPPAGTVLRLRGDSLNGVLANGDPVATWTDESGAGNNATQSTGNRPTFHTAVVNGRSVVRGAAGKFLSIATSVTSNVQHTMIAVLKKSSADAAVPLYNGDAGSNGYGFFQNTNLRGILYGGVVAKNVGTVSTTDFEIWITTWDGANTALYINGVEQLDLPDPSTAPAGAPSGGTFVMGLSGGNNWVGDVAELIVVDNVISGANRIIAQNFLGNYYNITVS